MTFTQSELLEHIEDLYNYFQDNKGDTKPNACNSDGIPYHSYDAGYHWQIGEHSTTSECLTLLVRAMVEAGYLDYAKQLADYVIANLNFDNIKCVHWLVNLVNHGVEMEEVYCGNYDGAVFTFTNGVAIIPAGNPWNGEKIVPYIDNRYNGIRGVFSTDTGFKYKDYWVAPYSNNVEYEVDSYEVVQNTIVINSSNDELACNDRYSMNSKTTGAKVTLVDTGFNGNAQIYYGIRNEEYLNKDELYRSYPLNIACRQGYDVILWAANNPLIINGVEDQLILGDADKFQLSCATDAIQWAGVAFDKLSEAIHDDYYSTIGQEYMDLLIQNSLVKTGDYTIFDATNRGLTYFSVYTYDETGTRNVSLQPVADTWQRFKYGAGTKVVQWGIGSAFTWVNKDLNVKFRGDGSGALKYVSMTDAKGVDYYYPFLDKSTDEQILNIKRGNFSNREGIFYEHSRVPYATPYTSEWWSGTSRVSYVEYSPDWEDSQQLNYPLWTKWYYNIEPSTTGKSVIQSNGGALIGFYALGGIETQSDTVLRLIIAADVTTNLFYKIKDANGVEFQGNKYIEADTNIEEIQFEFTEDYFTDANLIVHPMQNFELWMQSDAEQSKSLESNVYIAALRIKDKAIAVSPLSVLKFETRDTNAGYFDIGYAVLEEGNNDVYPYSGVAVFSNEYYEQGLMNWRSGSYAGYTNPYCFPGGSNNAIYASKFIYDSQTAYQNLFPTTGPSIPVYLRNMGENLVYGELETWTWEGPDPNTTWAGFQYRAMENMADHLYFHRETISANELGYCRGFLQKWCNYLYQRILQNDNIPSTFYSDGTLPTEYESPDFYAQLGRAMLLKHLVDWDTKSWYIVLWCYEKLIALKQPNGSYKQSEDDTYNFHQGQALLFLAELYNLYDEYKYTTGMTEFTWKPKTIYTSAIEFRTEIFEAFSGKEARTSQTRYPIRRWRLKFAKNNSELSEIRAYINSLKGRFSTFQWQWKTAYGGDGNTYICRLSSDNMITTMQHMGFGDFELVFEAIDENAYNDLTAFTEAHNIDYEQQEQHSTKVDDKIVANMAVNVQWEATRKRWNLQFEKNEVSRKWLENFFISKKGKYKEWTFNWSSALGGDDQDYQVRFDTDTLDFDVTYQGFGTFTIPIIEVL